MINKLQQLKCKTKLKFYKNISNFYIIKDMRMDEVPFAKIAQGINKIYHEVFLLMKFLQTKPHIKKVNINYYDLYYTVNKNRDGKEIMNDEENENHYEDIIIPNHFVRKKPRETILR